jgi:desulfoferrodoxin (superoxide reductase-like protein)
MSTQQELLKKVEKGLLNICGLEFDFEGQMVPSFSTTSQNFYDSANPNANWINVYFSNSSIKFTEKSNTSKGGVSFTQKLEWTFPNNDKNRSIRINEMHQVKYIKLLLTDDSHIVLGRNDFFQNTPPKITSKSDHNKTTFSFQFISIFSYGFLESLDQGGYFSVDIPITFINL